jgi:TolB-like protein
MNAGTLTNAEQSTYVFDRSEVGPRETVERGPTEVLKEAERSQSRRRNGLFDFIIEMRRRRVCRALTTYCVALWLVCQVVEIVSPPLGLPDWTLQLVIVQGMLGFPIALILSWLFEVTPDGLLLDRRDVNSQPAITRDAPRSWIDRIIDCGLLAVALVIGLQLALSSMSTESKASPRLGERITVLPFPVTSAAQADVLAAALLIELQHQLSRQPSVRIVAPGDPSRVRDGSSLTGAVVVNDGEVRVTAIMTDNRSGEVTWSELFEFTYTDPDEIPAAIARGIVEALTVPARAMSVTEAQNVRS